MDKLQWRCLKQHDHFLIVCRCEVFEVCHPIAFDLWGRTIERAWLLRRIVTRLTHAILEITEKAGNHERG